MVRSDLLKCGSRRQEPSAREITPGMSGSRQDGHFDWTWLDRAGQTAGVSEKDRVDGSVIQG